MKKYQIFLSENFHVLVVKFSLYLNRHVFVMDAFQGGSSIVFFFVGASMVSYVVFVVSLFVPNLSLF